MRWFANLLKRLIGSLFWKETIKIVGIVEVYAKDKEGNLKLIERGFNKVVRQGKGYALRNIIKDTTTYNGNNLILSTNNSTPADTETTVPNIITGGVKTASKTYGLDGNNEPYGQWEAEWGTNECNGVTINSIAIAENSDGTGEWCRYVLSSGITKTSDFSLLVRYRWQLQSS